MRKIAKLWGRGMTPGFVLGLLVPLSFLLAAVSFAGNDSGKIRWKPVEGAMVKLDDKTPLTWNVYQPDKKKQANLVLILLGHRYLALNLKEKAVYAVAPTDLHAVGKDFETDDFLHPSKKIASRKWTMRDIGPAESIQLTLGDYNGVLNIQLPHMPDLRPFY
ncbi:MAG TPA: hypothetical protein VGR36_05815 [Candidatus Acidoferrales bacterium]|nr:hypothetical protein [Candidatus Acidoferrales bacterium]